MAKARKIFVCTDCGASAEAWSGRCPHCDSWNTLIEQVDRGEPAGLRDREHADPVAIDSIESDSGRRMATGIEELDRVMCGGILSGSLNLIGGEPGIGKSTLMLQLSGALAESGEKALYATGEESASQVASRARRIGCHHSEIMVLPAVSMASIERSLDRLSPSLLIIDSIQTLYSPDLSSAAGSVSQVRHCTAQLLRLTKERPMTTFVVGHVTKKGALAGPKVMEHLVDAVIYFEGDSNHSYRMLRVAKNRFGSTNELGIFEMTSKGLVGIREASAFFLRRADTRMPGSAIVAVMEGSRPFLVEVQALTSHTRYGMPQRSANGLDTRRLAMLLAVLEKRCGMDLGNQDVYVNVAGGANLTDPGADLGVCLAVASSRIDRPIREGVVLCGEVGLGGEIRPVANFDKRLGEAIALGFDTLAGSLDNADSSSLEGKPVGDSTEGYSLVADSIDKLLSDDSKGGSWI